MAWDKRTAGFVGILLLAIVGGWFALGLQFTPPNEPAAPLSNSTFPTLDRAPIWKVGPSWVSPLKDGFQPGTFLFPEIMGAGCALFDFDGDGDLDIYLIQGAGARPAGDLVATPVRNRLLRQTAQHQFEDVSAGSGLDVADVGMGVAVGDVNNDGWPDVFLTNYGADRLLLNRRNGTFEDVTAEVGVEDLNWGASACFIDYDRDGWLDLCTTNYLDYDPGHRCADAEGELDYCNPKLFAGVGTRLYRNITANGSAPGKPVERPKFQDVTWESGIGQLKGPGLGVVSGDFNGDRWPDLYVANDGAANHLWINQQNGKFSEEAIARSAAYDNQGRPQASMGIALGDPDGDGDADLLVTHLRGENNALYLNDPQIGFTEQSARSGLAISSFPFTGFGTAFLDLELDGDLDLVIVNGAVRRPRLSMYFQSKPITAPQFWQLYAERNQVFINVGTGNYQEVSAASQPFCQDPNVARGLATGDIDNDGDIELLLMEASGTGTLFWNEAPREGHWLRVQAIEPSLGNRDAYGAQVTVVGEKRNWTGWVNAAGSYLAASDPQVHFGLGKTSTIAAIKVIWPNGDEETFPGGAVDRQIKVSHGSGIQP